MLINALVLSALAVSRLASAQDDRAVDPNNHFIFPPLPGAQHTKDPTVFWDNVNITYGVKQTQPFKWVSDMSSMNVVLLQEGTDGYREISSCSPGSFNTVYWDGRIDSIDINNGSQMYLAAWNCSNPGSTPVFFSHYFNLTQAVTTSSSSTTTGTASSTASTGTGTVLSTASATTSPTATGGGPLSTTAFVQSTSTSSSSSTSTANAAIIGGGVGGGIGGAILIVAAGLFFWKRQKKSGDQQSATVLQTYRPTSMTSPKVDLQKQMYVPPTYAELYVPGHSKQYDPSELP